MDLEGSRPSRPAGCTANNQEFEMQKTKLTASDALAALTAWDLTAVKKHAVKNELYAADEVDAVEVEYKKYLALCIAYPDLPMPTPLKLDDLWHTHILFTQDYAAMCASIGGTFIHHNPFVDGESCDQADLALLKELYGEAFGGEAPWETTGRSLCQRCGGGPCNRCQRQ